MSTGIGTYLGGMFYIDLLKDLPRTNNFRGRELPATKAHKNAVLPKISKQKSRKEKETKKTREHKEECNEDSIMTNFEEQLRRNENGSVEKYSLNRPYAYADIRPDENGRMIYHVIELELSEQERRSLQNLKQAFIEELDIDLETLRNPQNAEQQLQKYIEKTLKEYKVKVSRETPEKLSYFMQRDFIRFGKIDALMYDHLVEDISCNGPCLPVFIYHRELGSLPTNIYFANLQELNNFVVRLAHFTGKHISIASPVLDGSLRDGNRVQLTYSKEVTPKGSTFSIRRFRADPITIIDLIAFKTISAELAAWFWYVIEKNASILVIGATASGKTTTINALSHFIYPENKIVSIEDLPELNLPHENWVQSVARSGDGQFAITLFDLLKAALRQRPDYIILGEIRGEEAYTFFQAIATGHGGISSMHADSVESVLSRLESEPIKVSRSLVSTLDVVVVLSKVRVGENSVRKITNVSEIGSFDPTTGQLMINNLFTWNASNDEFSQASRSYLLEEISKKLGMPEEKIQHEIKRRAVLLRSMVNRNIRKHSDVAAKIRNYYTNPDKTYEEAKSNV